jgi:hypothetical protein
MTSFVRYFLGLGPAILIIFILYVNAPPPAEINNTGLTGSEIFINSGLTQDFQYLRNLAYLFYLGITGVLTLSFFIRGKERDMKSYFKYITPVIWGLVLTTFSYAIAGFIYGIVLVLTRRGVI